MRSHPVVVHPAPSHVRAALAGSVASIAAVIILHAGAVSAVPCIVPDNGFGTADLPPAGCGYASEGLLHVIDGLPPGSQLDTPGLIDSFFDIFYFIGGIHGGEREQFKGMLHLQFSGTGAFAGYNRNLVIPLQCETHSAPRVPATPLQAFPHEMYTLQGQLPPGDPDFDLLRITGGTGFGLPSPGHTTLSQTGGGWAVDSFFDITYRIDFIGSPGGPFAGMSGSTTATIRFICGEPGATPAETGTWGRLKSMY